MTYKILYSAPTLKGEMRTVTLSEGETKEIDGYTIKLNKVLEEPTEDKTGSALITKTSAFGRVMSATCAIAKSNWGGSRGGGRPKNDRNIMLSVRITQEAMDKLNSLTKNKAEYIDKLILAQ